MKTAVSSAPVRAAPLMHNGALPLKQSRLLKGDLDNIVLKALRKEPSRRYLSVEQFAEDLRRHLQGLPVTATPDSLSYRAGKFIQRHRIAVSAFVVILLAIIGGTAATIREARIAAANARRAERRFNDVRKLANSLIFEVHDSIYRKSQGVFASLRARRKSPLFLDQSRLDCFWERLGPSFGDIARTFPAT